MYLKDIIRGVKDMIKIDLITGFLGAGKTTFIKKYASYLMKQGKKIGILENDFGAINVDMLLLQDLEGDNCTLEMIAGGCDADCHSQRIFVSIPGSSRFLSVRFYILSDLPLPLRER